MILAALLTALAQEQIDNPEFKAWTPFKPGSTVTFQYRQEGRDATSEQKSTLKSVADGELVIETESSINGKVVGKPIERKVPSKIPAADYKKVKDGEEEIEVAGMKMKCRWAEIERKLSTGKVVQMKFWTHDDVPGRAVKIEVFSEGTKAGTMTATAWEKK